LVLKKKGKPIIVCVVAQKGGAGKSLYITNIAATLAMLGYNVLVIDTDDNQRSVLESFADSHNNKKINSVVLKESNIIAQLQNKSLTQGYDVVLVDGKAGITDYSKNILSITDYWLLPIMPSTTHFRSFLKYLDTVITPVATGRKNLKGGVVITGRHGNSKGSLGKVEDIKENLDELGIPFYEVEVKYSDAFEECQDNGICIFQHKPNTKAAQNWYEFMKELCADLNLSMRRKSLPDLASQGAVFKKEVKKLERMEEQHA